MAKLVVNPTSANRREIALGRTLISIGRDPSNDLVLPDAMVSRRHAVIECRGAQYYLRDCNSSNGSVVNGDRVSEKGLRDGDLVAIGSARLLFKEEAEATEGSGKVVPHPSAPKLACPGCEATYRKGDVYCRACGARLPEPSGPPKLVCAACGTAVLLPAHFCNACGAKLPEAAAEAPVPEAPAPELPGATSPSPMPRSQGALARATPEPDPSPAASPAFPRSAPPEPSVVPAKAPVPEAARPLPVSARASSPPAAKHPSPSSAETPLFQPAIVSAGTANPAQVPAPPTLRALSALLDLGLLALAESVLLVPLLSYWWAREVPRAAGEVAFVPVLLSLVAGPAAVLGVVAYYVWSWGVRGATTGQKLLDLAVVGDDGRSPIGAGRAGIRLFGYLLSTLSLGVGFLLVPLTGSGLHDRIAGTRVVLRRTGAR